MRTGMLVIGLLLTALCWARPAAAASCLYPDPVNGKAMKWPTTAMPIKYLINASKVAAADKTAFIDAVKAAFTAYEAVTCSELKFTYGGESTSVSSDSLNAILVIFSDVGGTGAYYYVTNSKPPDPAIIVDALIQMNVKDYTYVVGKKANSIDVQTAVTQMLPGALGFYVGNAPATGQLDEIKYDYINTTLSADQKAGVQFLYFKAGAGCTQPTAPAFCQKTTPPGDGVKKGDGGVRLDKYNQSHDDRNTGVPGDGRKIGGEPVVLPPPSDDGCCRVGYTRAEAGRGLLALAGLGLLLALRRRRR